MQIWKCVQCESNLPCWAKLPQPFPANLLTPHCLPMTRLLSVIQLPVPSTLLLSDVHLLYDFSLLAPPPPSVLQLAMAPTLPPSVTLLPTGFPQVARHPHSVLQLLTASS